VQFNMEREITVIVGGVSLVRQYLLVGQYLICKLQARRIAEVPNGGITEL
jgi:hypothetical protein